MKKLLLLPLILAACGAQNDPRVGVWHGELLSTAACAGDVGMQPLPSSARWVIGEDEQGLTLWVGDSCENLRVDAQGNPRGACASNSTAIGGRLDLEADGLHTELNTVWTDGSSSCKGRASGMLYPSNDR